MAHEPPGLYLDVPLRRAAIREEQAALLLLAERLRSPGPAEAQGIALASRLLDDPASPLRRGDEPGEIWSRGHAGRGPPGLT